VKYKGKKKVLHWVHTWKSEQINWSCMYFHEQNKYEIAKARRCVCVCVCVDFCLSVYRAVTCWRGCGLLQSQGVPSFSSFRLQSVCSQTPNFQYLTLIHCQHTVNIVRSSATTCLGPTLWDWTRGPIHCLSYQTGQIHWNPHPPHTHTHTHFHLQRTTLHAKDWKLIVRKVLGTPITPIYNAD
jgi:hypothetical protein